MTKLKLVCVTFLLILVFAGIPWMCLNYVSIPGHNYDYWRLMVRDYPELVVSMREAMSDGFISYVEHDRLGNQLSNIRAKRLQDSLNKVEKE